MMTTCRTAGLIAALVILLSVAGWSQEGDSPVADQRSLPTLELSDVVVVGVERAGQPQGIRHRELPAVPPAIVLSTVVNIREFSQTTIGIRHIPGIVPIGVTHFLTTWVGGANHRSADAFAAIHARGNTAQGILHFDWISQNGTTTWQDRHDASLHGSGSVRLSNSLLVGFQGKWERQSWRAYKTLAPSFKYRLNYFEGDILTEWSISSRKRLDILLESYGWSMDEDIFGFSYVSNRSNAIVELHGGNNSLEYIIGFGGWLIARRNAYDDFLAKVKSGIKFPISHRIVAGITLQGTAWRAMYNDPDQKYKVLPDAYVGFDLYPLFNMRLYGGLDVSMHDVSELWMDNPYLDYWQYSWIEEKPGWIRVDLSRSVGKQFQVRGWSSWERIDGFMVYSGFPYSALSRLDPDSIEITKAGLGFHWQPVDYMGLDVSGEKVWGKNIESAVWDDKQHGYISRSGGVPNLEDGNAQITVTVAPIPDWTFSLSGHLHGERPTYYDNGTMPSYGTLGAEIRWKTPMPVWVTLWGENLTDTHYDLFPGYEGEPFRIGIRLGFMTSPY